MYSYVMTLVKFVWFAYPTVVQYFTWRNNDDDEDNDRPADDVSAMLDVAIGQWGAVVGEEGTGDVGWWSAMVGRMKLCFFCDVFFVCRANFRNCNSVHTSSV